MIIDAKRTHGDVGKPEIHCGAGVREMHRIDPVMKSGSSAEILDLKQAGGGQLSRLSRFHGHADHRFLRKVLTRGVRTLPDMPDLVGAGSRPAQITSDIQTEI